MIVAIDNSQENKVTFYFQKDKNWIAKNCIAKSKSLLERLEIVLKKNNLNFKNLSGLIVVVGKGRFTATRIVVTLANCLSFGLKIPIISVDSFETTLEQRIALEKLKKIKKNILISAKYSAEVCL